MAANPASRICADVDKKIKKQAVTLAKAVIALQDKIEQQLPNFAQQPLAQILTTTQGEEALRQNPAVSEFRATVRDYAAALKSLQDIVERNKVTEKTTSLADFRAKIKAVSE